MNVLSDAVSAGGAYAAVANHLWQSGLCTVAVALLALALRRNSARVRYWLWLGASIKFLVPFALLVAVGSRLAWESAATTFSADVIVAVAGVTRPFSAADVGQSSGGSSAMLPQGPTGLLPLLVLAIWCCGSAAVLAAWGTRWRRAAALVRQGRPLEQGRELEVVRRLERTHHSGTPVALVMSAAPVAPGIFGVRKPVLLWPRQIGERLGDAEAEAILAHELSHVRRRDNLTGALHTFVQAVFWFHPFVWFVGARLVQERERACDEAVVQMGNDPQAYAQGILTTCEFSIHSPAIEATGVAGSHLKERIETIMTNQIGRPLDAWKKLFVVGALVGAVSAPLTVGAFSASPSPRLQPPAPVRVMGAAVAPGDDGGLLQTVPDASQARGTLIYKHARTGITFEIPESWLVRGTNSSSDNGEMVVMLATDTGAFVAVWMIDQPVDPADIGPWLDGAPQQKLEQRLGSYAIPGAVGYRLREGSIQRMVIGVHDAIVATAEYTEAESGQAMAEYMTWIYTRNGRTFFFARVRAADLHRLKPQFDAMVRSAVIP